MDTMEAQRELLGGRPVIVAERRSVPESSPTEVPP